MDHIEGSNDDNAPWCVKGKVSNEQHLHGGTGVYGESISGIGVDGETTYGIGVYGESHSQEGSGVYGVDYNNIGVEGESDGGPGVFGHSKGGPGVIGQSKNSPGVFGLSSNSDGIAGVSYGNGVLGNSYGSENGVLGLSYDGTGVFGSSHNRTGVRGESTNGYAMFGLSKNNTGVFGSSESGDGVIGSSGGIGNGVNGFSYSGNALYGKTMFGLAALLDGNVKINGQLTKSSGQFKIDHPLDPANKYLCHSFVESPDMKNVYDGLAVLDDKGEAEIYLPDWFGALNKDFRYQLTAIGAPGPNLYISEEIISDSATTKHGRHDDDNNGYNGNSFKIAGGKSGMKVSWQVTGIRKDPWANAHRIRVEENKSNEERGHYMYPKLYGQPEEKGMRHVSIPKEEGPKLPRNS